MPTVLDAAQRHVAQMDGIVKRLAGLNQLLFVLLSLTFLAFSGRRASTAALETARDLEALSLLKGAERDPAVLCASNDLQTALDAAVQRTGQKGSYLGVRDAFTRFLKEGLHFADSEIVGSKRGLGRTYFFANPVLHPLRSCPLDKTNDQELDSAAFDTPPNSVEAVLQRNSTISLSNEVLIPVGWAPPARPEDALPQLCLRPNPEQPPGTASPAPLPSSPTRLRAVVPPGPPSPSMVPPLSSTIASSFEPHPSQPEASSPGPHRLPKDQCKLERIYFTTGSMHLVWHYLPPPMSQEADRYATTTLPAKVQSLPLSSAFFFSQFRGLEDGWKRRLTDIANDEARRERLVSSHGGVSVENAVQQSQKVYADLVGNRTLFGWNLLPEWFPLAVGGALATILLTVLVTCRYARRLAGTTEIHRKAASLETIFFLSLSTRAGMITTWTLVPAATMAMSFATFKMSAALIAEVTLGTLALAFGALSVGVLWDAPTAEASEAPATTG